jgi:cysteinyl-tRNA synthetase
MKEIVQGLLQTGYAYEKNGSIYYKLQMFKNYFQTVGKRFLERNSSDETASLSSGKRNKGEEDKLDPRDFVLWKANSLRDSSVTWNFSSSVSGRPGWHLECSAMCLHHFQGKTIDIHAGGIDLIFPHHTNEIVQSEAYTGTTTGYIIEIF